MDSEKMTLMKLWQRVEAMNYMDFALGGHNVSRPADVIQMSFREQALTGQGLKSVPEVRHKNNEWSDSVMLNLNLAEA